jgi:asparagine synthase (glutamine-hydrolysing)
MCGIAGIYGNCDRDAGARMLARLSHRGPDGDGSVELPGAWLGHRRLSIVDVQGGAQPLRTEDERLFLVGNGEIYNHDRLRERLEGVQFLTGSDNEAVLHLVDEHGPQALYDLKGMYAMLIAGRDGTFVAARDPVGIKPLYWARRGDEVRFASEIAAFDPDWRADVELFPPGHYWTPERGLVKFEAPVPYHPIKRFDPTAHEGEEPPPELYEAMREELVEAVERRMMADVPVGVFLSGGLDSSIVAAIAARHARRLGKPLLSFAVGSEDSSDLERARYVADHLGTEHHERRYGADELRAALPEVVRVLESFDASLVRSAVPNYLLSELAARRVKVVLTGEGADELFAGYEYLREICGDEDLHIELVRTVESLHGLNLQRADRVTMAHGLEARVPFLDIEMIAFSLALPAAWKLPAPGRPEKWLLRRAFEGWVPDDVLWREKEQFGDGSGAAALLRTGAHAGDRVEGADDGDYAPRSAEEAAYYRIFRDHLGDVAPERTIELFATA